MLYHVQYVLLMRETCQTLSKLSVRFCQLFSFVRTNYVYVMHAYPHTRYVVYVCLSCIIIVWWCWTGIVSRYGDLVSVTLWHLCFTHFVFLWFVVSSNCDEAAHLDQQLHPIQEGEIKLHSVERQEPQGACEDERWWKVAQVGVNFINSQKLINLLEQKTVETSLNSAEKMRSIIGRIQVST